MPGSGGWVVSGYTHVRELGSGASGRVVLAVRDDTGARVAIKYLAPQLLADRRFLERFRSEARLLGGLRDPHLVGVYDYVESEYGAAIVMELVDGVSLRRLLVEGGRLDPLAALVVLKGSLHGLAAAHAAGVVHRDYKPENVLVPADAASRLVDFGIAVPAGDGGLAGTPAYMSPEQWAGSPVSAATDVYAATVVFFECLTGAAPYRATTLPDWARAHHDAPIPVQAVPEPVRGLVAAGMAKTADQRPGSAAAFVEQLETTAQAAYGPDWEARGRRALAAAAAALAALFPLALADGQLADGTGSPPDASEPGHGLRERTGNGNRRGLRGRRGSKVGLVVGAGVAALVILVGGGAFVVTQGDETTGQPPGGSRTTDAAATASPSPTDTAPKLPRPVCDRMDLKPLVRIFDRKVAWYGEQNVAVGTPSLDTCSVQIQKGDFQSALTYGVSVLPADRQRLASLRRDYERTQGQFVYVKTVEGVGDGGYGTDRFVLVLTHGRLLKVSAGLPQGQTFEQLRKAAKVAAGHVGETPDAPAKVTVGECERLDGLAEKALGQAAVVRRDHPADKSQGLCCGWATKQAAVSVKGSRIKDAKKVYEQNLEVTVNPEPVDVGDEGSYDDESTSVQYRIGNDLIVHVNYTPFGDGSKGPMVALAKASEPLFR